MFSVDWSYRFKFCKVCKEVKPPRSHHCHICGCCVLRMDHHCPWIGNCVGLLNHKLFWLFLFYSGLALTTVALALLLSEKGSIYFPLTMLVAFALGVSLIGLLLMHTVLILNNWSTVESYALFWNNIFREQSYMQNWKLVFGDRCLLWFLPISNVDPMEGLDYGANVPVKGLLN